MKHKQRVKTNRIARCAVHAVDLFCGVGGLTCGLERAGVNVRLGVDVAPTCEYPFTANNKAEFLKKSVNDVKATEIEAVFPEKGLKLLAGCAPCQTFSTYNQKARPSDKRWWLIMEFARFIEKLSPELVTMENVPGLVKQAVFEDFLGVLKKLKYAVDYRIIDCSLYGIPQHRERLVLLASKLGPIELIPPSGKKVNNTVRRAIGSLPPLEAGAVHHRDSLHRCASLSDVNFRRIRASKPGSPPVPTKAEAPLRGRTQTAGRLPVTGRTSMERRAGRNPASSAEPTVPAGRPTGTGSLNPPSFAKRSGPRSDPKGNSSASSSPKASRSS